LFALSPAAAPQESVPDFNQVVVSTAAARDQSDRPRAVQLYKQAVQINPTFAEGWWSLGLHKTRRVSWRFSTH
jgi:hypothetical protein